MTSLISRLLGVGDAEADRLNRLTDLGLDDIERQKIFDDIAALARRIAGTPSGYVTIVGDSFQWTCGIDGKGGERVRREDSFCAHTILDKRGLLVEDAALDPRFAAYPAVLAGLRFYAGAPILTGDGLAMGAVCVVDDVPRPDHGEDLLEQLRHLASLTRTLIEARRSDLTARSRSNAIGRHYERTLALCGMTPWQADERGELLSYGRLSAGMIERLRSDWPSLIHPDDAGRVRHEWEAVLPEGHSFVLHARILRRGVYRHHRIVASSRVVASGARRWFGVVEDVEGQHLDGVRLHEAEAELHHLSRIAAMETMASTLAHELNQPLSAITSLARASRRMLLGGSADVTGVAAALDDVDKSALRAGDIVRSIRQLVSRGDLERRVVPVADLLEEAVRIAGANATRSFAKIEYHLDPQAKTITVDPIQIQQVVINLVKNAMEAMARTGDVRLAICTKVQDARFVEIAISDHGPGIPEDMADRLFSPFVTSKPEGMGIGLSISRTIIDAHGGKITAEPNEWGGTVFRMTLPLY